ncbi:MAG TPA: hypothetical protein PKM64_01025, partial [Thermoanaerobaculia bacterium]|nr:hypothetical protein [Thermoanaerobaculia bacterium]
MERLPTDRQLLIALHADEGLSRPAACALGVSLAAWRDAGPEPGLARTLGVPARQLARGRELLPHAAALAAAAEARAAEAGAR